MEGNKNWLIISVQLLEMFVPSSKLHSFGFCAFIQNMTG